MCGIAGIIGNQADWHASALDRMVDSQAHRGPDDAGVYWLRIQGLQIGFGHRRLAIQDLSDAGRQPMRHPETDDLLVFNGEIYNAPTLRKTLASEGIQFRGHSDTEVLLQALRRWGTDCLRKLDGMYAFAWFDQVEQRVVLARDPLGIKPLYFARTSQALLFASEVSSLVSSGKVSSALDTAGLRSFFAYGAPQAPRTILRDVEVFPAGHWQAFKAGSPLTEDAPRAHWTFPGPEVGASTNEEATSIRELLADSVRGHLVSDVPVGVFLSSGIDSTIVASLAAREQSNIESFTVGFSDAADHSEAELAKRTANLLSIPHQTLWLSQDDAIRAVTPWLESLDQPSMDGLNTYVISQCVRGAGIIVALSGQGGDELFGGYPWFADISNDLKKIGRFQRIPAALHPTLIKLLSCGRGIAYREKLADTLVAGTDTIGLALQRRRCFSDSQISRLLKDKPNSTDVQNHYLVPSEFLNLPISDRDPVHAVSLLESRFYLGNTLLPVGDSNGMRHGLEIRLPMLDRPLLNHVFRMSGASRLPNNIANKYLLRAAFPEFLRPELSQQAKRGFILPLKRWMIGPLREICESSLSRLRQHASLRPSGIDGIWNAYLSDPESSIWSRAWTLVALGAYLQRLDSLATPQSTATT